MQVEKEETLSQTQEAMHADFAIHPLDPFLEHLTRFLIQKPLIPMSLL